jgi:hypothetical protein
MRLDKELGTLNREVVAIKERWKIALNIDSKKVAIERLITMRKKLRDNQEISKMVEVATQGEKEKIISASPQKRVENEDRVLKDIKIKDNREMLDDFDTREKRTSSQSFAKEINSNSNKIEEKPAHLTVSWLKDRLRHSK